MDFTNFEKLHIYHDATRISRRVWEHCIQIKNNCPYYLRDQVCRSADSIGANIAEGCGRGSKPDKRKFAIIARGSGFETKHWMIVLHDRGFIPEKDHVELQRELQILLKRISSYIRALEK